MKAEFGTLPAAVNEFNSFRSQGASGSALYDKLPEEDVLALLHANVPGSYEKCGVYEKAGWLKYTGNQHNEKWDWTSEWLGLLKRGNALASFLAFLKAESKKLPYPSREVSPS